MENKSSRNSAKLEPHSLLSCDKHVRFKNHLYRRGLEWGSEATFKNNLNFTKKLGALTAKTKGVFKGLIVVW